MPCSPSSRNDERGLGLIEFLLAMLLLAAALAAVLTVAISRKREGQLKGAESGMHLLMAEVTRIAWERPGAEFLSGTTDRVAAAVEAYSSVPAAELLTDPWGRRYLLSCDGETLVVFSCGPDGKHGTRDCDEDNLRLVGAVATGKAKMTRGVGFDGKRGPGRDDCFT